METLVDRWNSLAESWWSWAWPGAWQAALVAALVLLVLRFARRWPAPLRHGLVLVALLKFVTPPLVSLPTGVFSQVTVSASSPSAASVQPAAARVLAPAPAPLPSASSIAAPAPHLAAHAAPSAQRTSSAWSRIDALALLFALYVAGVLVAFARLARHALEIQAERRRARAPARAFVSQHEALSLALGFRRVPELRISRRAGPMAIGLFSPAVLVPQTLARLGAPERAAILAHELVHHRRRDLVVAWATALVKALWWWHPAVLVLARAARETREECCDDLVLERGLVEREAYCRSLLRAACLLGIARSSSLAAAYHEHPLGARFRRLFDERRSHRGKLSRPAWGLLAALALVLLPGLGHPAQKAGAGRQFTGLVVGPDGKPVAGASLSLRRGTTGTAPLATSDERGRFTLALDADQAGDRYMQVIAARTGYGLAWADVFDTQDVTLHLSTDSVPIRGRVLDLEGRPIEGARVSARWVGAFKDGELDAWLAAIADKTAPSAGDANAFVGEKRAWLAPLHRPGAVTGADGRFELRGVGNERVATVLIEKDGIATAAVRVVTREIDTLVCATRAQGGMGLVYRGASFTLHAVPARDVSGKVSDASGRPLAGVEIRSQVPEGPEQMGNGAFGKGMRDVLLVDADYLRTRTDAEGRFALHNLPPDPGVGLLFDGYEIGFGIVEQELGDAHELHPETTAVVLPPLVSVRGRVQDASGKPVARANVRYHSAGGSDAMMTDAALAHAYAQTDAQGAFEFKLPAGKCVVAVGAGDEYAGLSGISSDEAKELEAEFNVSAPSEAAFARLDLSVDRKVQELALVLQLAPKRRVEFVDPEGKPLTGVRVLDNKPGLWHKLSDPLAVTYRDIRGSEERVIIALHPGRNLIGALTASANGAETLRLLLQPAAAIRGRLVDIDRLPRPKNVLEIEGAAAGMRRESTNGLVAAGMLETGWSVNGHQLLTDAEGRFVLTPLVPGWTYSIFEASDMNLLRVMGVPVTPKSGETIDIGDVQALKE